MSTKITRRRKVQYDEVRKTHEKAGCQQGKNCTGAGCKVRRKRKDAR